jgi:hypothetical protein
VGFIKFEGVEELKGLKSMKGFRVSGFQGFNVVTLSGVEARVSLFHCFRVSGFQSFGV